MPTNLKLTNVEMKAHESYLKQSVVEIMGKFRTWATESSRRWKSIASSTMPTARLCCASESPS